MVELSGGSLIPPSLPSSICGVFVRVDHEHGSDLPHRWPATSRLIPMSWPRRLRPWVIAASRFYRKTGPVDRPGTTNRPGGVAKGYAVDRAAELLRQQGVERALIDLGGDIYALGSAHGRPRGAWGSAIPGYKDSCCFGIVESQ